MAQKETVFVRGRIQKMSEEAYKIAHRHYGARKSIPVTEREAPEELMNLPRRQEIIKGSPPLEYPKIPIRKPETPVSSTADIKEVKPPEIKFPEPAKEIQVEKKPLSDEIKTESKVNQLPGEPVSIKEVEKKTVKKKSTKSRK